MYIAVSRTREIPTNCAYLWVPGAQILKKVPVHKSQETDDVTSADLDQTLEEGLLEHQEDDDDLCNRDDHSKDGHISVSGYTSDSLQAPR